MISNNLLDALESAGFTYTENAETGKSHAYAIYGGYLTTVYEASGKINVFFNFRFSENPENAVGKYAFSESFSEIADRFSLPEYSVEDDGLRISFKGSDTDFLRLLDSCIAMLSESGIRGSEYCSVCGNKFGIRKPKKVTNGFENTLMCEHCAIEALEEHNKEQDAPAAASSGSAAKGIIGSVLFSLIGLFVYIALYYWVSPAFSNVNLNEIRYIFCAAGFLVSFLAYIGYRMFSKKVSLAAYITIPVVSVIVTAVGQYLGVVLEYVVKNGFNLGALKEKAFWLVHLRNTVPDDVADKFTSPSDVFYKLLIISLMFACVGAAIFLLSLRDSAKTKKEPLVIETITVK